MKAVLKHISLLPVIGAVCCTLTGCVARSSEAEFGLSASKAISTSRVVLPSAGGQTIQVPTTMMTDAYELWQPLNDSERRRLRSMPTIPAEPLNTSLTAWLPPSEIEVMQQYLYRLTHSGRDLTVRVLGRAEGYLPTILETLNAHGIPQELACLPMVESAFEPRAVSHAGAAGLWQLMPDTARRFGLTVNSEIDERFDVHKATAAAAAYLATLYSIFHDWPLAVAAYNCGEGAMQRALSRTDTATLPELTQACREGGESSSSLAEETLRFVPQFAAAVQFMSNSNTLDLTTLAVSRPGQQAPPRQDPESSLTLTGRYGETASQKPQTLPARSQRIE